MEKKQERLDITSGEWKYRNQVVNNGSFFRVDGDTEKVSNIVTRNSDKAEANAKLIADAGTTYNKCQTLPSQLLSQNNELLECLEKTFEWLHNDQVYSLKNPYINQLESLIQKLTVKP